MKSYLLDTHIFLRAYGEPEKLGKNVSRALGKGNALYYVSTITLIEIAQLYENKPKEFDIKIPVGAFINQALTELRVQVLPIAAEHAQRYYEIQPVENHKDPFDRIIIAQAAHTGFTALSDDRYFPQYPIVLISN